MLTGGSPGGYKCVSPKREGNKVNTFCMLELWGQQALFLIEQCLLAKRCILYVMKCTNNYLLLMTNHINIVITVLITKFKNLFFQNMCQLGKILMILNYIYIYIYIIYIYIYIY